MKFIAEFKEFAVKGNVVDMAVGVIIGTAFGKIVSSLINDLVMPVLGTLTGKVHFSKLFINLGDKEYATLAEAKLAGAPTLNYGNFIQSMTDFLVIAISIFFVVKAINNMQRTEEEKEKKEAETPPEPSEEVLLLREIRDALSSGKQGG